jgi:hypothetical protein
MKSSLLFILFSVCLFSCSRKRSNPTFIPINGGIETLYGHVKDVETEDEGGVTTEQSYYATINLSKRGDSITVGKSLHGSMWFVRMIAIYDPHGKKVKMLQYNPKMDMPYPFADSAEFKRRRDSLAKQVVGEYTYNQNGYLIKFMPSASYSSTENYIYKYNAKGDMIECNTYIKGISLKFVTKYTYDSMGRVIEEESFRNQALTMQTEFTYLAFDSQNNWIKRKASYDYPTGPGGRGETKTFIRKITYY